MPFILQYTDYDEREILGLYHTREEAEEALDRYVKIEIPRYYKEQKERFKWLTEREDGYYTPEDIKEQYEYYDREEKEHPEGLSIWELGFGDIWGEESYPMEDTYV